MKNWQEIWSGILSRRINIQHRLVYQVYEEPIIENGTEYEGTIKIIRMWTHYDHLRETYEIGKRKHIENAFVL